MSSLREAMARVDGFEEKIEVGRRWERENHVGEEDPEVEAHRELIVEVGYAVQDTIASAKREEARQEREDEFASWAMEIIMRARQKIGRTKWSTAEGVAKRRIVEALRCLPSED